MTINNTSEYWQLIKLVEVFFKISFNSFNYIMIKYLENTSRKFVKYIPIWA